jgi:deoxyribodipyrimidine photolyase-related protein
MKAYFDYLKKSGYTKIRYTEFKDQVYPEILKDFDKVECVDPLDYPLKDKLSKHFGSKLTIIPGGTPMFLLSPDELVEYRRKHVKDNKYTHATFYTFIRKHLNVLIVGKNAPKGGKWSFDEENREPFPKGFKEKFKGNTHVVRGNAYIDEAIKYVHTHFPKNFGETKEFFYPINHAMASKHLQEFLKERFKCFGPYQDAVSQDIDFGCHSVLSSSLNIGIITPEEVLREALSVGTKNNVPLNSIEGFVRQLIGWREYIRMVYHFHGKEMPSSYRCHGFPQRHKLIPLTTLSENCSATAILITLSG